MRKDFGTTGMWFEIQPFRPLAFYPQANLATLSLSLLICAMGSHCFP